MLSSPIKFRGQTAVLPPATKTNSHTVPIKCRLRPQLLKTFVLSNNRNKSEFISDLFIRFQEGVAGVPIYSERRGMREPISVPSLLLSVDKLLKGGMHRNPTAITYPTPARYTIHIRVFNLCAVFTYCLNYAHMA